MFGFIISISDAPVSGSRIRKNLLGEELRKDIAIDESGDITESPTKNI